MDVVLTITAPVFGLAIIGYVAGYFRWIDDRAQYGLTVFVFNFAVPALLFRAMATRGIPADLPFGLLASFYLGGFTVFGLAALILHIVHRRSVAEMGIAGMSAAYSNVVLLGVPLILTAFGEAAQVPLFLLLAFHSLIYFPLVTVVVELGRSGGGSVADMAGGVARGLFRSPIVMSLIVGILWSLTGWGLPQAVDRLLDLMGQAVAPAALFAMGAALNNYRIAGSVSESAIAIGLKLFVHPALVWLLATQVFAVPPLWASVATVLAACPTGVNAFIFAERYGAWARRAGTTVALSSGLAILTITLLLYILEVR